MTSESGDGGRMKYVWPWLIMAAAFGATWVAVETLL